MEPIISKFICCITWPLIVPYNIWSSIKTEWSILDLSTLSWKNCMIQTNICINDEYHTKYELIFFIQCTFSVLIIFFKWTNVESKWINSFHAIIWTLDRYYFYFFQKIISSKNIFLTLWDSTFSTRNLLDYQIHCCKSF